MEKTTIQISKENWKKLEMIKGGNHLKYDDLITVLLKEHGGEIIFDTETINRDSTALTLRYWKHNNKGRVKIREILYSHLKTANVGDVFVANANPNVEVEYRNSSAKVIYREGDDVVLLVKECDVDVKGRKQCRSDVIHFNLF